MDDRGRWLAVVVENMGEQKTRSLKTRPGPARKNPEKTRPRNPRPRNPRKPENPRVDRGRGGCENRSPDPRKTRPKNPIFLKYVFFLFFFNIYHIHIIISF